MIRRRFNRLYIHVPFCRAKCDYCAFYSEPGCSPSRMDRYLERLLAELDRAASWAEALDSVFIGGGTPALLGEDRLRRLLRAVRDRFEFRDDLEWSCESTPSTLSPAIVSVLAEEGVNRVSIGVQTFCEALRRRLGRRDPSGPVPGCVEALRRAGIPRLNMDLIYGIPGQTAADWEQDLHTSMDLGVEHLSAYCLTVEEGTRLAESAEQLPDDDLLNEMWDVADAVLASYGLQRYEVSNFCRDGCPCRHNLGIWQGDAYAGAGPVAASFDGVERRQNVADLDGWLGGEPALVDRLEQRARAAEMLAFGLRVVAGWDTYRFRRLTGYDPVALRGNEIRMLADHGLLQWIGSRLCPTAKGLRLNDIIAEELLMDNARLEP